MKRAFVISDCHLASALVPEATPDIVHIGDRIMFTRDLDLGCGVKFLANTWGTIDFIDAATGFMEILMDVFQKCLIEWDNHAWLEPFETDDILDSVICVLVGISSVMRVA